MAQGVTVTDKPIPPGELLTGEETLVPLAAVWATVAALADVVLAMTQTFPVSADARAAGVRARAWREFAAAAIVYDAAKLAGTDAG
jgi:hypothetical protein